MQSGVLFGDAYVFMPSKLYGKFFSQQQPPLRRSLTHHFFSRQFSIQRRCKPKTARYAEDLPGGIGRFITGEVDNRSRNFLRQTDPVQRNMFQEQRTKIIAQVLFDSFGSRLPGSTALQRI